MAGFDMTIIFDVISSNTMIDERRKFFTVALKRETDIDNSIIDYA